MTGSDEFGEGTPIAVAAFALSASDPTLPDRLRLLHPEIPPARDPSDWGVRPVWLFRDVRIDLVGGRYFYRFEPHLGPRRSCEWEVVPWNPTGSPDFGRTIETSIHSLKVKAQQAWSEIAGRFESALFDGTIKVTGRPGSPLAARTVVPKEAWAHFRVEDWDAGYAEDDRGERLHALAVPSNDPIAEQPRDAAEALRRGRLVRQTKEIIEKLFPNDRHKPLTDKELTAAVRKHIQSEDPHAKLPSVRTIRRASGRDG